MNLKEYLDYFNLILDTRLKIKRIDTVEPPKPPIKLVASTWDTFYVWYNAKNGRLGYVYDITKNEWVAFGTSGILDTYKPKKSNTMNTTLSQTEIIKQLQDVFDITKTIDDNMLNITTTCLDFIVQDYIEDYEILGDLTSLTTNKPTPDFQIQLIFHDSSVKTITFSYKITPNNNDEDYDAAYERARSIVF